MTCGKKTYETKALAKKGRKELRDKGITLTNIYFCSACNGYHLTSMSKRKSRRITRKAGFTERVSPELKALRKQVIKANHD